MPDNIRADIDKIEASTPSKYERRKPQYDEFLRWVGRIVMFQMCVLIALLLGFWWKLDRIYNGNPNSDGKKLVCAILKDDAASDKQIDKIYQDLCSQFHNELSGE